jgi:glycosyltransferase involved in cell wall biosynthesis
MESTRAVQIVSLPVWLDAAAVLRARRGYPIVYDCHDRLAGFSNMAAPIVAAEKRLFAEADLVVFSSRTLLELHPEVRDKAQLVPNGVDTGRFSAAPHRPDTKPPVAGYVGAIEEWFDVAAVREAALGNPDCRFIVAGRVEYPPARKLSELPNVEMPGEVPYAEVPALVERFDIGLIPFIINDLTRAADPIKLYEYFACGIPVVSARLPEVEPHGELVYLASAETHWPDAVRLALAETDPARRALRVETASRADWRKRAEDLGSVFNRLLLRENT